MSEVPVTAVIGGGAWGTAFALHLWSLGLKPRIWAYEEQTVRDIEYGENKVFLPEIHIPGKIIATNDINKAMEDVNVVFLAVPVQHISGVLKRIDIQKLPDNIIFVNLAKGIERGSFRFPSQIIIDAIPNSRIITLSGPSFAYEVARGKPTVLVAAGEIGIAERVQKLITGPFVRVYRSADIIGVEIGGALKNVFALAAGMIAGLGFGENTRAALIVRGLAEVRKLSMALGADNNTIFGISGLGDLVLTCTSEQSRNYRMGKMIAEGGKPRDILKKVEWIAEGVFTASAAVGLSREYGVEMPITEMVDRVIESKISPQDALHELMSRPLKEEFGK